MPRTKSTKKVEKKSEKLEQKKFRIVLTIAGKDNELFANNIPEALVNFEPLKLAGKCIFTIYDKEKKFSRMLYPRQLRRLYGNKLSRDIFQKQMLLMLQ